MRGRGAQFLERACHCIVKVCSFFVVFFKKEREEGREAERERCLIEIQSEKKKTQKRLKNVLLMTSEVK